MSTGPMDTTDEAREAQFRAWRSMGGERCLLLAMQMSDEIRRVTAAGIRHRHPNYSDGEVRWALLRVVLGEDLFAEAFPTAPLLEA